MRRTFALPLLLIGLLSNCSDPSDDARLGTSIQALRATTDTSGRVVLGMDFLTTQENGRAFSCSQGKLTVTVRASKNGKAGPFVELPRDRFVFECLENAGGDYALVVDNSGSEHGYESALRTAASTFADRIASRGGRVSLVRVSTEASVISELTSDVQGLHASIDRLTSRNGWTALYDGIRLGNETLGAHAEESVPAPTSAREFCRQNKQRAIVAFTDGRENNSGGEKLRRFDDDGIDTRLGDIERLKVKGVSTPIYTVGLGRDVDHGALTALAKSTGGRHFSIGTGEEISTAFEAMADYALASRSICLDIPDAGCGSLSLKVDWTWSDGNTQLSGSEAYDTEVACNVPHVGRIATVLLTLSNPGIPRPVAATIAKQAAQWVASKDAPRVLLVRDDGHHDEYAGDTAYIRDLLKEQGLSAELLEEPKGGLSAKDVAGFDAVIMSNPGYPIDDARTLVTLENFVGAGGGLVLQGDDMAQSWAKNASMSSMTRLEFIDNGTSTCGKVTNDERGEHFTVELLPGHPISKGLEGTKFLYGDDIDLGRPLGGGEVVVASASLRDAKNQLVCTQGNTRPAIVAYDPVKK